ncbi:MAG: type II toxin-antitoxin system death-on-curing family toxin [Methanothrix sp.]|jgi:death-on-curing protein|nr:type II toxin-antitoxin system death-on-curing family toxin [Methanothrix sp.]NLX38867.1 type II toxin-antitoxin system death-on-curing family toxin [Methanothrix sp.]HPY73630.1 type II toxin-antitoxin system death-on-curing family toxin [Methanothrix sp.]
MIEMTPEMVISIHDDLIQMEGGTLGILNRGTLDCLVDRINRAQGVFEKATWALCIAKFHPFYDGQKRTAFTLAAIILRSYGYYLSRTDEEEIYDALIRISEYKCNTRQIELWLKRIRRKWWAEKQRPLSDYF